MTLLTVIQNALYELGGTDIPDAFVASTNDTSKRMLALAKRQGDVIARAHNWTRLNTEYTFTTVAAQAAYALPSDYHRFLQCTWWDRTSSWRVLGPASPSEWQALQSANLVSGIDRWWRLKGGEMLLYPTPPASGDTIAFEYQSNAWCASSGGTAQSTWAADSDVFRLDERLLIMGLKCRWLQLNGLDYSEEENQYEEALSQEIARDGGNRDLRLNGSTARTAELRGNIPDHGVGS